MDRKALYDLSYGVFLLSAKAGDRVNGCITNTCIQVASSPVRVAFSVLNGNLTCEVLKEGGVFSVKYESITTKGTQELFMDAGDARKMQGKRVVILDDVISTGESLAAMEKLVEEAGGNIVGRMAVLAEGDAAKRDDIIFLEKLPLFNSKGEPLD